LSKDLIIFGNGGLASVVRFFCEKINIKVAGFAIDKEYLHEDVFEGLPNISFEQLVQRFSPSRHLLFIAIGASDMLGFARQEKMIAGLEMGYELASYIFVKDEIKNQIFLGNNTFIMPGCKVDPFVKFGDGVIAWNGSIICHHTNIGNYSFIAPGATICGKITVGEHCFIGSNSTIRDNLLIAPQTLIGAGAVISHDTDFGSVYMPAQSSKIDRSSIEMKIH